MYSSVDHCISGMKTFKVHQGSRFFVDTRLGRQLDIPLPKVFGDRLGVSAGFLMVELIGSLLICVPYMVSLSKVKFHRRCIQEVFHVTCNVRG